MAGKSPLEQVEAVGMFVSLSVGWGLLWIEVPLLDILVLPDIPTFPSPQPHKR